MKFGSLFSGIEAASAAWLPLGWSCAWVAEIDPFASAVLRHHYPHTPNLGDITEVDWNATEPVDLVVGGPPCQDFSVAGKRAGLDGERGDLSLAYVDALDAIDPAWSLTENVPGWLSMGDNSFGHFLARLVGHDAPLVPQRGQRWTDAGVVAGPRRTAAWRICDAQYWGVPQRRRRVFVVAVRGAGDFRCADALFPQREGVQRDTAPRRQAGEGTPAKSLCGSDGGIDRDDRHTLIAGTLGANGKSAANATAQDAAAGMLLAFGGNNTSGPIDVATACNAHGGPSGRLDFESETLIAHSLRADGFDASEDGTGRGTPLICGTIGAESVRHTNGLKSEADLLVPVGAVAFAVIAENGSDIQIGNGESVGAISTGQRPGHADNISTGMSVRRLTPVECERLQGFPNGWTQVPYRGRPAADGNRYRAIGNSMAVPVIAWLGRRIQLVTDTTEIPDAAE